MILFIFYLFWYWFNKISICFGRNNIQIIKNLVGQSSFIMKIFYAVKLKKKHYILVVLDNYAKNKHPKWKYFS
jgi:hypothetical protein